jgi:2-iminobutanoate/2-iminopropanoate deaminase
MVTPVVAEQEEDIFMKREAISTSKAPAAIGPYSQAIAAGDFVFISGQIGLDPATGKLISPDFELQAKQTLENLRQIVLAAGCQMNQLVSVDVFLSNLGNFSKFNEIYSEFFTAPYPARAAVEVGNLPKGSCVEIKAILFKG